METKAEIGVTHLQAKECQGLLEATTERPGMHSPSASPEGTNLADTAISDLQPLEPQENKFLWF